MNNEMNGSESGSASGVSAVIAPEDKGGRPSKYEPETVNLLLAALADGLNQKQACLACGISGNTLKTWREKYPEFEAAMTEARETARRKVLAMIKSIGEEDSDWRALDAWLQRSFPADYRRDSINIRAEASAGSGLPMLTKQDITELQERRARLMGEVGPRLSRFQQEEN